jgi:hypothetical protein
MTDDALRKNAKAAAGTTPWDLANGYLYELCRDYPTHHNPDAVLAKILIIGRVYTAAIERRQSVDPSDTGDSFYLQRVVPDLMNSHLDDWISEAKETDPASEGALDVMVRVHKHAMDLFNRISGLNKRSLASKYLHFHVPELFFIYDTRAVQGVRGLRSFIRNNKKRPLTGDHEYSRLASKCAALTSYCRAHFDITLSPRKLDNLLLNITR